MNALADRNAGYERSPIWTQRFSSRRLPVRQDRIDAGV